MAWPSTPLTTYIAGTTPTIKAADLNSFQTGINGIINGTYTLSSFVVDGTGGSSVVTPRAGTGMVSAASAGTTTPSAFLDMGQFGKAGIPIGFAYVAGSGSPINLYNVFSVTRLGLGSYSIVFNPSPNTPTVNFAFASLHQLTSGGSSIGVIMWSIGTSGSRQAVNVNTYNLSGAAQDGTFTVGCWGE